MAQCGSSSKMHSDAQPRLSIALITATHESRHTYTHKLTHIYTYDSYRDSDSFPASACASCNQTKKHKWATKRKYEYLLSQ